MIFTTFWFLIFGAIFLPLFYAVRSPRWRSIVLALASLTFYVHFAGPAGMAPILVMAVVTYLAPKMRKPVFLVLAMTLCAMALVTYKYTAFLFENLVRLVPAVAAFPVSQYAPVVAPLAISFFVFEFIHYLYDVKKGTPAIRNPLEFFHFAMFFPTLVAGPIKRYEQFIPALKQGLASASPLSADFQWGFLRVAVGFAKKLIADSLTVLVTAQQAGFTSYPLAVKWVVFAALAMRIYLDFSGYSDMAIGFARMMGIKIPENFNWPYLATSAQDFWRRWHISLSSWIRDYLYVPLGGNRVGTMRRSANLLTVFFVCGLWHGAAWNYVLWGLYHGFGLVVNHGFTLLLERRAAARPASTRNYPRGVAAAARFLAWAPSWALTTFFVWTGWLLFFYPPGQAWKMFLALFGT